MSTNLDGRTHCPPMSSYWSGLRLVTKYNLLHSLYWEHWLVMVEVVEVVVEEVEEEVCTMLCTVAGGCVALLNRLGSQPPSEAEPAVQTKQLSCPAQCPQLSPSCCCCCCCCCCYYCCCCCVCYHRDLLPHYHHHTVSSLSPSLPPTY